MTEQEAYKLLTRTRREPVDIDMPREQLEELQLEIHTAVNIALKALEKQIPKKPVLVTRSGGFIKFYPCPSCSTPYKYFSLYPGMNFCNECGQKLKWGEE